MLSNEIAKISAVDTYIIFKDLKIMVFQKKL